MIRNRMTKETWRGSSYFGSGAASIRGTDGLIAGINNRFCQRTTTVLLTGVLVGVGQRNSVRIPAGA